MGLLLMPILLRFVPRSHIILQVLAPLPIGFAVFMVHLATIPITGTGINPARSFGAAVIYNKDKAWDDQVPPPVIYASFLLLKVRI